MEIYIFGLGVFVVGLVVASVFFVNDEETKKYETEIKKMEDDRADLYSAIVKLKTSIEELNQKGLQEKDFSSIQTKYID